MTTLSLSSGPQCLGYAEEEFFYAVPGNIWQIMTPLRSPDSECVHDLSFFVVVVEEEVVHDLLNLEKMRAARRSPPRDELICTYATFFSS